MGIFYSNGGPDEDPTCDLHSRDGTATRLPNFVGPQIKSPTLTRRALKNGGPDKDRTCDLLHAMQALSQLSYGPVYVYSIAIFFRFEKFFLLHQKFSKLTMYLF